MSDDVLPSEYKGYIHTILEPWGVRPDLDLLWRMAANTASSSGERAVAMLNGALDECVGNVMRQQLQEDLSEAKADSLRSAIRDLRRSGADQILAMSRIISSGPRSGEMTTRTVYKHTKYGSAYNDPNNPAYSGGPDSRPGYNRWP